MSTGFKMAARALRQLGAELITSDDIALNELIKNAFDAGAKRVTIEIRAPLVVSIVQSCIDRLRKEGLSNDEAEQDVSKKALSEDLGSAERKRILELLKAGSKTRTEYADELERILAEEVTLSVRDTGKGMNAQDLRDAFLVIGTPVKFVQKQVPNSAKGSRPILGDKGIGRLSMMRLGYLATVTSSEAGEDHLHKVIFDWRLFDDPNKFLDDIPIKVLRGKPKDNHSDSGTEIKIQGLAADWDQPKAEAFAEGYLQRLQDPFDPIRRPFPVDVILNGKRVSIPAMEPWFSQLAHFRADFQFDPAAEKDSDVVLTRELKWRSNSSKETREWSLSDILKASPSTSSIAVLRSLGPFRAACLWFNRSELTSPNIDKSQGEIKDELNKWCGGFAIYRDGFRVGTTGGMKDDWLEMDQKALKAQGFTLNRYQTVGSVAISYTKNPHLIDAANRQGLISGPAFEALRVILGDIVVLDLRSHINAVREVEAKKAISEETTEDALKKSRADLTRASREVEQIAKAVSPKQRQALLAVREVIDEQVQQVGVLRKSLELARETRAEILELAGIGIVVEIVVHELVRITQRTHELLDELTDADEKDVDRIISNLQSQIKAANKRLRTVDALSPSGRQRKEEFDITAVVSGTLEGYRPRFERNRIECQLLVDGKEKQKPVLVKLVRGLVAQVLENLLTNAEYWVQQGTGLPRDERKIMVDIDSSALTVSVTDNGPGVDPKYREDIFKPYFTTRPKGKGLGLFIAREIALYHEGSLFLDASPDKDGRLRTFTLELPRK